MNTRLFSPLLGIAFVACLSFVVFTGCDTTDAAPDTSVPVSDVIASADEVAASLQLLPALREKIRAAFEAQSEHAGEPGFLWYVADELQTTLTDAERAELEAARERYRDRHGDRHRGFGRMARHMDRHMGGQDGPTGGFPFARLIPNLTDAQREQLADLRETYADAFLELRESYHAGTLSDEQARAEREALWNDVLADLARILTEEQLAVLNERRAEFQERRDHRQERRAQARAVAIEVLGLTHDQQDALQALFSERREAARVIFQAVRDGSMNRNEAKVALKALREEGQAARAEILTVEQLETMQIHRALVQTATMAKIGQRGRGR